VIFKQLMKDSVGIKMLEGHRWKFD